MAIDKKYTEEELVNMKVFTIGEAQAYVEKKLGMGRAYSLTVSGRYLIPSP
ncbi:hypothetical protein [Fodinibius sp.]|uniref:hypothetical protein n=1 Tax=Fodinibius sp. TaxID=1872440 RepID=UPI002ACE696D|nr:hypothetical protein [Fodinibius sp.]MDZ7658011.1 hypothetical protein [Fodinibius sp.]